MKTGLNNTLPVIMAAGLMLSACVSQVNPIHGTYPDPVPEPERPEVSHIDSTMCKPWMDFLSGSPENVLLDFSYAGYSRGERSVPEVNTLGYKVYNVCDYGAIPDDDQSDRNAFLAAVYDIIGARPRLSGQNLTFGSEPAKKYNAVIYFPEGHYILHTEADNGHLYPDDGKAYNTFTQSINIVGSNIVIKGAGRDKTFIEMVDPGQPQLESQMYSGSTLIRLGAMGSVPAPYSPEVHATGVSQKGDFTVQVSAHSIKKDDWVAIYANGINDPDYIDRELDGRDPALVNAHGWNILSLGVNLKEYHQVKSVTDKTITFYEPIMHEIIDNFDQHLIGKYNPASGVGLEDITFIGHTPESYSHHGSFLYDSGWKIFDLQGSVNSWARRLAFDSVTEGVDVSNCANCSVYDIEFYGVKGHNSLRSASSTRIFLGASWDHTDGTCDGTNPDYKPKEMIEGAGCFHGVGVNSLSIGAVIWRNHWGKDSNFESHASQPRATLLDANKGAWIMFRGGGDANLLPNHLQDLTVWNMENELSCSPVFRFWGGYQAYSGHMTYVSPIVVGLHGGYCDLAVEDCKYVYNNGASVGPESLYEAQLKARLGYVPSWLLELKGTAERYKAQ